MQTKLSKCREAALAGDWVKAISIAAKFPQLGDEKVAIMQAHNAHLRPAFYRQIGRDPVALFEAGKVALRKRYGWQDV